MTQEQKDLLLKDLCSRLPYGVVIQEKCVEQDKTFLPNKEENRLVNIDAYADLLITNCGSRYYLDEIKPYLFPISSMTEEQKDIYGDLCYAIIHSLAWDMQAALNELVDWLNENHFDYNNLIPMGLANDCTNLNIY